MNDLVIEKIGTLFFIFAVLHTFSVKFIQHWANQCKKGSLSYNLLKILGEVEVVFGIWAGFLLLSMLGMRGSEATVHFIEGISFGEPLFVFAIMTIAATRPILDLSKGLIFSVSRLVPLSAQASFYITSLVLGPLMGSLITEPAAMTVTAFLLKERFFDDHKFSTRMKYFTLGILFVNVSVGGALTPYAAPPILMVAKPWGWGLHETFQLLGLRSISIVLLNAGLGLALCRKFLMKKSKDQDHHSSHPEKNPPQKHSHKGELLIQQESPYWLQALHGVFLVFVVLTAHHTNIFMGIFLFFLGVVSVTKHHQEELQLKQSLLVSFFLGGLVVLGQVQSWWLQPMIEHLNQHTLFLGATLLTAVVDNAALTYLGTQIQNLSADLQYALVAGAITGGGLTVIANAPNPAGYAILRECFGKEGISPFQLFKGALIPTLIGLICFMM